MRGLFSKEGRNLLGRSNAVTDSNTNPIGITPNTNVTVSSAKLSIPGTAKHQVFLIGHYCADPTGAAGGIAVAQYSRRWKRDDGYAD